MLPLLPVWGQRRLPCGPTLPAHTHYLHAIADLRAARAYLSTGDEQNVEQNKGAAIIEIDQAVSALWRAARRDGKSVDHPTPIDVHLSHYSRFTHALTLLTKAHQDLTAAESNQTNFGLRNTAFAHVDRAIQDVHRAIQDVHRAIRDDRADDRRTHS